MSESGKYTKNRGQLAKYYVSNHHPAIISQEDWNKAQQVKVNNSISVYPWTKLLNACNWNVHAKLNMARSIRWFWLTGMMRNIPFLVKSSVENADVGSGYEAGQKLRRISRSGDVRIIYRIETAAVTI